jgi:acetyl-CoA carboxylase biotin carboxyl carrier protein
MAKPNDLNVDGDLVRALAALLEETGLSEIEYAEGDRRIRVVRGAPAIVLPHAAEAPASAPAPAAAARPAGAVTAPMVGTAHLAPQPGAPPFVSLGDAVTVGQVLLIIEAMKVMNQIDAPRAGKVVDIRVGEGAPVEYGQVLMVIG